MRDSLPIIWPAPYDAETLQFAVLAMVLAASECLISTLTCVYVG
jgi:hypothetical protein